LLPAGGAPTGAPRAPTGAPRAPCRLLALDHAEGDVYALALAEPAAAADARAWLQRTCGAVEALAGAAAAPAPAANGHCGSPGAAAPPDGWDASGAERPGHSGPAARTPPPFRLRRPRRRYLADVQACLDAMCAGESYELCLTTALARRPAPDAAALYSALRRINPAPYAAFLAFGAGGPQVGARPARCGGPCGRRLAALCAHQGGERSWLCLVANRGRRRDVPHHCAHSEGPALPACACRSPGGHAGACPARRRLHECDAPRAQVCCSSPERFLRGERGGGLEARPVKGTAARQADPAADAAAAAALAASEKDRAENLMIVDLLRNDLGRVCQARARPPRPRAPRLPCAARTLRRPCRARQARRRLPLFRRRTRASGALPARCACGDGAVPASLYLAAASLSRARALRAGRQRARAGADPAGEHSRGAPAGEHGARRAAAGRVGRGVPARHVPGRVHDRRAQAAQHADPGRVRPRPRARPRAVARARAPPPCPAGQRRPGAPVRARRLEEGARGVYSGSVGYFSANGTFDLNIVIRTAVIHDGEVSIGAGGAVVVQSSPEAEYEEMRLKARALLRAVGACDGAAGAAPVDADAPYTGCYGAGRCGGMRKG